MKSHVLATITKWKKEFKKKLTFQSQIFVFRINIIIR